MHNREGQNHASMRRRMSSVRRGGLHSSHAHAQGHRDLACLFVQLRHHSKSKQSSERGFSEKRSNVSVVTVYCMLEILIYITTHTYGFKHDRP